MKALNGEGHRTLFLVLLYCGLRPGEALALRWSDLDLDSDEPTLQVNRALQLADGNETVFASPKTKRGRRTLALPASVTGALLASRKVSMEKTLKAGESWREESLVFPSQAGTPLSRNNIWRAFLRISKAAELGRWVPSEAKRGPQLKWQYGFRLYDLRHTAATLQLAAGVDARTVSENLGHAKVAFTLDTYAHSLPATKRSAADKMEKLLGHG